jgi:hypothetical protein
VMMMRYGVVHHNDHHDHEKKSWKQFLFHAGQR